MSSEIRKLFFPVVPSVVVDSVPVAATTVGSASMSSVPPVAVGAELVTASAASMSCSISESVPVVPATGASMSDAKFDAFAPLVPPDPLPQPLTFEMDEDSDIDVDIETKIPVPEPEPLPVPVPREMVTVDGKTFSIKAPASAAHAQSMIPDITDEERIAAMRNLASDQEKRYLASLSTRRSSCYALFDALSEKLIHRVDDWGRKIYERVTLLEDRLFKMDHGAR